VSVCEHDWAPYDTSYKAGGWEGQICVKCGEEDVFPPAEVRELVAQLSELRSRVAQAVNYIENVGLIGETWGEVASERILLALLSPEPKGAQE
jgi:hypothetical protein